MRSDEAVENLNVAVKSFIYASCSRLDVEKEFKEKKNWKNVWQAKLAEMKGLMIHLHALNIQRILLSWIQMEDLIKTICGQQW